MPLSFRATYMIKPVLDLPPYNKPDHVRALAEAKRVALLMAPRLGDTLLMMTMARNLISHGREVTIFGDYAYALRAWFPGMDIRPSLPQNEARQTLIDFDCAAQMHAGWPAYALHDQARSYFYYDAHVVVTGKGFIKVNQIRDYCRDALKLPNASTDNGLRPLMAGRLRSHRQRVAIHPASTSEQRCWAARHFVDLGHRLSRLGFDPVYILAAHERERWSCLVDAGLSVLDSSTLSGVAEFIHECGWFIGNESGIGHLASNVGVPTLTLTGRPTRTKAWRPGWAPSCIVYPAYIPGGRLRDRYWREWLRPGSVVSAFKRFVRTHEQNIGWRAAVSHSDQ